MRTTIKCDNPEKNNENTHKIHLYGNKINAKNCFTDLDDIPSIPAHRVANEFFIFKIPSPQY